MQEVRRTLKEEVDIKNQLLLQKQLIKLLCKIDTFEFKQNTNIELDIGTIIKMAQEGALNILKHEFLK